jgi:hypothetical protein
MVAFIRSVVPWFGPQFPPEVSNIANSALQAYVLSHPVPERLSDYLRANCPAPLQRAVKHEVADVFHDAETYLYAQRRGVRWDTQGEQKYFEYLRRRHRWLSSESRATVVSYGRWLSMHEGLDAPERTAL